MKRRKSKNKREEKDGQTNRKLGRGRRRENIPHDSHCRLSGVMLGGWLVR